MESITVSKEDFTSAVEYPFDVLCTEASTLRIKPGDVPRSVAFRERVGNGQAFYLDRVDEGGAARYTQLFGSLRLRIFAD